MMPDSSAAQPAARLALAAFMGSYPSTGEPDPVHTVHAAKLLRDAYTELLGEAVGQARSAGHSWDEVGALLFDDLPIDLAVEAWDLFAPLLPVPQYPRFMSWRCVGRRGVSRIGCEQMIRDYNPTCGIAEEGHAGDCARHARDLAEEQERRDMTNGGE